MPVLLIVISYYVIKDSTQLQQFTFEDRQFTFDDRLPVSFWKNVWIKYRRKLFINKRHQNCYCMKPESFMAQIPLFACCVAQLVLGEKLQQDFLAGIENVTGTDHIWIFVSYRIHLVNRMVYTLIISYM